MTPETIAELRRRHAALTPFALRFLSGGPGGEPFIALACEDGTPLPEPAFDAVLLFAELAAAELPAILDAAAERDALAAKVDAVRALHTPVRYYTDPCDDPECERELVELSAGDYYHADTFELMCEVCSGGDMSECDYDNAVPHPCPTVRALDATPETGGES